MPTAWGLVNTPPTPPVDWYNFSSRHTGVVMFGFADGSVHPITVGIDCGGAWNVGNGGAGYVPGPVAHADELFLVRDAGQATCRDALTGKLHWNQRLGKHHSASPVCAEGRLYFPDDEGNTFVVKADRKFELIEKNSIGEECYASPAISRGDSCRPLTRADTNASTPIPPAAMLCTSASEASAIAEGALCCISSLLTAIRCCSASICSRSASRRCWKRQR